MLACCLCFYSSPERTKSLNFLSDIICLLSTFGTDVVICFCNIKALQALCCCALNEGEELQIKIENLIGKENAEKVHSDVRKLKIEWGGIFSDQRHQRVAISWKPSVETGG